MSDTVAGDYFKPFPVMKLDYDLQTDLKGDVERGRSSTSPCGPPRPTSALPGNGEEREAGRLLERRALVAQGDAGQARRGWWKGTFTAAKRPGGFVSVRASATNGNGYSIKQEIIRAYGLR